MSQIGEAMQQVREHLQKSPTVRFTRAQTHILTSELPEHWRSNKSLQIPFTVLSLLPVPDGTRITVHAGNEEAPCGEVRNAQSEFKRQCAKFSDLRFVGKSGRGRTFHLTLVIHTDPLQVIVVARAIKVTVDGPREPRPKPGERSPLLRKFPWDTPPSSGGWPGFPSPIPLISHSPHSYPSPIPGLFPQLYSMQLQAALLASRPTPFLSPSSLQSTPLSTRLNSQASLSALTIPQNQPSINSHQPSNNSHQPISPPVKHFSTQADSTPTTSRKRKKSMEIEENEEVRGKRTSETLWRPFEATR
ncbi:unnamed protein product, partial [Mesorhabditis belari]|uniref:Runt domain-containing protein n=1 Tax=Mesorhabditis belari TaxID=2138241 RepID=A0AAF3ET37_9BILA